MLAVQFRTTECTIVDTPVPVSVMVSGELLAVLVMTTLPLTGVVFVGVNVTVRGTCCPAVNTCPAVTPDATIPVPVVVMVEIVRLVFPLFVSVTLIGLLLPIFTFPNVIVLEVLFNTSVAATLDPVTGIVSGELDIVPVSTTEPFRVAAASGE